MCYTVYKLTGEIKRHQYGIKAINIRIKALIIKGHHYINTVIINASRLFIIINRRSWWLSRSDFFGVAKRSDAEAMGSAGWGWLWCKNTQYGGGLGAVLCNGWGADSKRVHSLGVRVLLPLIPKIPVDRLARGAILVIVGIVAAPRRRNGQSSPNL